MNLEQIIEQAKPKYEDGQQKYGGLITDKDQIKEQKQEIIDLWFYSCAEIIQKNKLNLQTPELIMQWSLERLIDLDKVYSDGAEFASRYLGISFSAKEVYIYELMDLIFQE